MNSLSIIVPAYNVEKYIDRCLQSILQQNDTEKFAGRYEIVVVDDGSTDTTAEIVVGYCSRYPLVKLVCQENGGLSSARNTGIDNAANTYLWFVDSDDWIAKDALEIIFENIDCKTPDILEFDVVYATENKGQFNYSIDKYYEGLSFEESVSGREFIEKEGYIISVTSKIVKKTLYTENNITFPLGRFSEDNIVAFKLMAFAERFLKIKAGLYYYYQRDNSITKSKDKDHQLKYLKDQLINIQEMQKYTDIFRLKDGKLREMMSFIASNMILSLMDRSFTKAQMFSVLEKLQSLGIYPIPNYNYHNDDFKRNIFRIFANSKSILALSKFFLNGRL